MTVTQEEDGPSCPVPYLRTFSTGNCTSLSSLLATVALPFLSYFSLSWFLSLSLLLLSLFLFLGNSTDKGSSLPPVLCKEHVRNAYSHPINSEESSPGLCANEWELLYSNKTLFIDYRCKHFILMYVLQSQNVLLLPIPPSTPHPGLQPPTTINSTFSSPDVNKTCNSLALALGP